MSDRGREAGPPTAARPLLQLALDEVDLDHARAVAAQVAASVQVMEIGTLLLAACGVPAVAAIRADHPRHVVVADLRIMRAGRALAELCFDAGADWITVMAEAPDETLDAVVEVATANGGAVQIEPGDTWDAADLARWRTAGAEHVILHQGHEADSAGGGWTTAQLSKIDKVDRAGLAVSVTGGIEVDQLGSFDGVPVSVFIAGRAIRGAPQPGASAAAFAAAIERRGSAR